MRLALSLMVSVVSALAAGTEAKVKLPNSRTDLLRGEKLFQVHCALCHGPKGEGGRGCNRGYSGSISGRLSRGGPGFAPPIGAAERPAVIHPGAYHGAETRIACPLV